MLIPPRFVEFSTQDDVVDYVSRGLFPPRRVYYESLVSKIRNPDNTPDASLNGKEVQIPAWLITEANRDQVADVLDRVYENRCRNVKKVATGVGVGVVAVVTCAVLKERKRRKAVREIEAQLERDGVIEF